ncbi:MAG: TIGR03915 family putative DNA repair protein [Clostridiales bacterium]|nr:TIGR03915 family putative DNA repair protein [Clostridiales bacterium]
MENDLEYIYDGTFEGFLCCIYQSYVRQEVPKHIYVEEGLPLLGETAVWIPTNWNQAQSVYVSLSRKIGIEAQDIVKEAFLTHLPNKEIKLYRYIRLGYDRGRAVLSLENWEQAGLSDMKKQEELILTILQSSGSYRSEVKNIEGKLQFRSYSDVMISCITPRNRVLPALADYFEKRFLDMNFLVYDKTHQMAAVHREEGTMVTLMKKLHLPVLYDEKNVYEYLWKSWYDHLHIEVPQNPRYALNEMKSRLWCELLPE